MRFGFFSLLCLFIFAGCSTIYYNKYGGYPIGSETYILANDSVDIKLIVTYRNTPVSNDKESATLNVSVKPIIDKNALSQLSIDAITITSSDSTFLNTYTQPSVYDKYGKNTLVNGISERLCLFTIPKSIKSYNLILTYRLLSKDNIWVEYQKLFPLTMDYRAKINH